MIVSDTSAINPTIITRKEAIRLGLRWYFTGEPCTKGHIAKRSLSNFECRRCVDERAKKQRREHPERLRAKDRRKYWRHVDVMRSRTRDYRRRTVEDRRAYDRNRYHENPERRAYQMDQGNRWWRANRGKKAFMVARRRSWIKRATPPWLTPDQARAIRQFYVDAAALSKGRGIWHVDHIVPLRGDKVCGLHVPWNLQVLRAVDNRRKRNVFHPA